MYARQQIVIHPEDHVDGIKPDGSFQQHIGLIYDGKSSFFTRSHCLTRVAQGITVESCRSIQILGRTVV